VALVTSSYNFIADGVALTLNRWVAYLESRGVAVKVFAPVARAPAFVHAGEILPVPSTALPVRSEYRLAWGFGADGRREFEAFDPDIVHVAVPDILGHRALSLGRALGRPVVASYHTRYETYLKDYGLEGLSGAVGGMIRRFYAACDEVYAPSPSMIDALLAQGFSNNLYLWRRGVDVEHFSPSRRDAAFRAGIGAREDEVVVAFVGRLVREKRLETVAAVGQRLRQAGLPHRLLIVGDGPDRAVLARRLPEAAFTGFLSGADLARAYASSDVFLFPSDTESFGNVTLEAMASGLPTVCADATGSRSLVQDGTTGSLCPPGDEDAFFRAVSNLVQNASLRRRQGEAARALSLRYSWDETFADLLLRYRALAGLPRRAAA
jgi:glycosyltransferase involved in cell wall biosynthesis